MKQCPNCHTKYTDDTLKFCLQDGTLLINPTNTDTEIPTVAFTDSETLVTPRQVERLEVPIENSESHNWEQSRQTQVSEFQPETKKSNTLLAVALTAFVMLLLFVGGIGMWFYLKNGQSDVVKNNNKKSAANQNTTPKSNSNANVSTSPEVSPSPTVTPTSYPTATPTATPAPSFNPEQVQREVSEKISAWNKAIESYNLNGYMNYYADTVDYYTKKDVSLDFVRKDKQKAFSKFDYIKMDISNLRVTPDASGERATAVFDKEWNFEGEDSYSSGKVQSQLQLQKFSGRWLITGERDLKVYYKE